MHRALIGILLIAALGATPVAAGDEEKGWFVGVEATSLRPSGGVANYVIVDPDADGVKEGTIQSIEIDNEIAPRVVFGWASGNGGMWSLSWWDYDEDAAESVSSTGADRLWATLIDANTGLDVFQGTAAAALAVEASTIDLTYSRPLTQSDKFSTRWHAGLRTAELDRALGVIYDNGALNTVLLGSEADGFGFGGGLSGTYKFNDHWSLHGGSSYAAMMGDFDTFSYADIGGSVINDISGGREGGFSMLEARLSVVWHGPDFLYAWAGLEYQQWNDVVETNNFPDDIGDSFLQTNVSDVTFDGFTMGVGITF